MNTLDLIASLVIGAYLIGVVVKGNTQKLLSLAKRDKAFLKWAIALAILWYLYNVPELKGPVGLLIFAALLAFFMGNLTAIQGGVSVLWNNL